MLTHEQAIAILQPQWESGAWAKSSGELLWAHSYKVWSIAHALLSCFSAKQVDAKGRKLIELACLVHDVGKLRADCQERLRAGHAPGNHKLTKEEVRDYFATSNKPKTDDKVIQQIWDIARPHHGFTNSDFPRHEFNNAAPYTRLLMSADWLASMSDPEASQLKRICEFYDNFELTLFRVSRFASPTATLAVQAAIHQYGEETWKPLLVYDNAVVFIGPRGLSIPSRDTVAKKLETAVVDGSLRLQKPVPTGYTGDFLSLLSKQYPDRLLVANKDRITVELGTDKRALIFLKLARDIIEVRHDVSAEEKEASPLLSIVDSANSTAAHPKAKQKYERAYGKAAPAKVNNEMIAPAFERSNLRDVLPKSLTNKLAISLKPSASLRTTSSSELFDVLVQLAQPMKSEDSPGTEVNSLQQHLQTLLCMEEETDFRECALATFEAYKRYKQTSDAEKGACERCTSPVVAKMQPALNFATSPQAFSQIKPKYQYRAVCPLCGYDNLVVRSGTTSGSRVFVRVESELPGLFDQVPNLQGLVDKISSALRNPRRKQQMRNLKGFEDVPFPRGASIPLSAPVKNQEQEETNVTTVRQNERGLLLQLHYIKSGYSPKDLRAKYEPLFHVLRFLGFRVAIGTEEQSGLFDKPVITTPFAYKQSLAVVFLASVLDKNQNKYIFAAELLKRSPSTALTYAAGDGRDKYGLSIELLETFIEYLVEDKELRVSHRSGEITMKDLLRHAALLSPSLVEGAKVSSDDDSDEPEMEGEENTEPESKLKRFGGMWTYCEHRGGGTITKHSATKPISQALNELMLGRGVDFALNKFMQNLNVKIKKENTSELTGFIAEVRGILEAAEKLRDENVTDFLRYKNGLLSAVYMLTRYPNLKPVALGESPEGEN